MNGPIKLSCPLCERQVHRIEQRRDHIRPGLNVTTWHHSTTSCFVVDDLYPDEGKRPSGMFEATPIEEKRHARA